MESNKNFQRAKELKETLNRWRYEYYTLGTPSVKTIMYLFKVYTKQTL